MVESRLEIEEPWLRPLLGPAEILETRLIGRFSTEIWRLWIDVGGENRTFALKRAVNPAQSTQVANERAFFTAAEVIPELGAWLPRYFGYIPQLDGLLLGWVDGLAPFDWRAGPEPRQANAAMIALAALHNLTPPPGIPRFDETRLHNEAGEYDRAWPAVAETLCGYCAANESAAVRQLGNRLSGRVVHALAPMTRYVSLLHGDVHGENLPARGEGICMLDWADAMVGDPGTDLADFIVMSYPPVTRREVEHNLLRGYAAAAPATIEVDAACRRGVLQRFVRTVRQAAVNPGWGATSLPWIFRRCALAALDWQVAALAGEPT